MEKNMQNHRRYQLTKWRDREQSVFDYLFRIQRELRHLNPRKILSLDQPIAAIDSDNLLFGSMNC